MSASNAWHKYGRIDSFNNRLADLLGKWLIIGAIIVAVAAIASRYFPLPIWVIAAVWLIVLALLAITMVISSKIEGRAQRDYYRTLESH